MTALQTLLETYCNASLTEREKGTYFEELICSYRLFALWSVSLPGKGGTPICC
jgi:hypothetical protein